MTKFDELEAIFDEILEEVEQDSLEVFRAENLNVASQRFLEHLEDEGINLSQEMKKKIEQTYNIEL